MKNKKSSKRRELLKRRALLLLPAVLFGAGILLVSMFAFNTVVKSSSLWNFIFTEASTLDEGDELDYIGLEKLVRNVEPEEGDKAEDLPDVVVPPSNDEQTYDYTATLPALKEGHYISESAVGGFSLGSYWASISVADDERVDDIPVYQGDNSALLSRGVGHLYGSSFPGEGGVCVLAAHVSGSADFFTNLADAEIYKAGTQIKLDTAYGIYVYEVIDTKILDYKDTTLVKRYEWKQTGTDENGGKVGTVVDRYKLLTSSYDADELLVMYTCYPKGAGFRTQRYYVICRRIYGYSLR